MKYFIAKHASKKPDLTIVIPALNEKLTIKRFIDWCKKGIANSNISAEIIIVDGSSDNTAEIALASGANVLKTKKIRLENKTFVR